MKKIKIEKADLLHLLEDHSGMHYGYLDRETGEVLMVFEDVDDEEEKVEERIEQDPDRYISIEPIDSSVGFRIMEMFVAGLPAGKDRDFLETVLSMKKPFSNFKIALNGMGDLREQWFDHHERDLERLTREWLEENEIDAELV